MMRIESWNFLVKGFSRFVGQGYNRSKVNEVLDDTYDTVNAQFFTEEHSHC